MLRRVHRLDLLRVRSALARLEESSYRRLANLLFFLLFVPPKCRIGDKFFTPIGLLPSIVSLLEFRATVSPFDGKLVESFCCCETRMATQIFIVYRKSASLMLVVLAMPVLTAGCAHWNHAKSGAVIGSLGGAAMGAMAGGAGGKADKGALVGAGLGALAGAAIGHQADRADAEMAAAEQAVLAQAITIQDVVQMSQAGVDETLIVGQIQAQGIVAPPTTEEIIALQQRGVSTRVILALQSAPPVMSRTPMVAEMAPSPTVIETVVVAPPPPPAPGIVISGVFGSHPRHPRHPHRR